MSFKRQGLPVEDCLEALFDAFHESRTVILEAPPGAGKTTLIPLHLLAHTPPQAGKILILEPRRLAARTAAKRMADLLGEKPGQRVGYRIRGESKISKQTRIEVVTEGILTRIIQSDPSLDGIDYILFDEFHERSLQGDLGLAFCLESQEALRDDLKLLIMSATLSGQNLKKILPHAPVIKSQGRQYPLEIRYQDRPARHELGETVTKTIGKILDRETGSLLIFLPGEAEIHRTHDLLKERFANRPELIIAPLYSRLDHKQQDLALKTAPNDKRKIVLATTIAETSLTIDGVRIVVDCGYKRVARFDEAKSMNILETRRISKAAADQRAGRAGRLEAGIVYRLWPKAETSVLSERDEPEILNADLMPLCVELAQWGVRRPEDLHLLDPPDQKQYQSVQAHLRKLNILNAQDQLSAHGKKVAALHLHPRLGHMIVWAERLSKGHQKLACLIAAFIEEAQPAFKTGADFTSALHDILHQKGAKNRWGKIWKTYETRVHQLKLKDVQIAGLEQAARLLAQAYRDRIAKQRKAGSSQYHLTNGRGASLKEGDRLAKQALIVISDMGAKGANGLIHQALPLLQADLESDFSDQLQTRHKVGWDEAQNQIMAEEIVMLDQLVLHRRPLQNPDQSELVQGFCDYIRKKGLAVLPWSEEARQFQDRLRCLGTQEVNWARYFENETLLSGLEDWLAPYLTDCRRIEHLERLNMQDILKNRLDWKDLQELDRLVPAHYKVPSGSMRKIDYSDPKNPFLALKLQEMFGTNQTPTILAGQKKLKLHLLSPAGRPLQVTDDIARFWENAYDSVKKEMKGRYPKHPWPDDPLSAVASAKTKKHLPSTK